MENWIIVSDKLSDKNVPRVISGNKAQEALAIEFGTHFLRLMNEERSEAEVQIVRGELIDGAIIPKGNRYKVACYRRDNGKPAKRYGGRAKKENNTYRGITTKTIHSEIASRIIWLEENHKNPDEVLALQKAMDILSDYLIS